MRRVWNGCAILVAILLVFLTGIHSAARAAKKYEELYRPQYHFSPARNWMNDPNGPIYYEGEYHLFFQYNPFGNKWGHMSWGHAVSRDMVHWQQLQGALAEENGVMIFSGSTVVDWHNSSRFCTGSGKHPSCLVAIYTGFTGPRQFQNIAYSNDRGRTWIKYAGNPVIDLQIGRSLWR
jgi:fructan beta-fructosidase